VEGCLPGQISKMAATSVPTVAQNSRKQHYQTEGEKMSKLFKHCEKRGGDFNQRVFNSCPCKGGGIGAALRNIEEKIRRETAKK